MQAFRQKFARVSRALTITALGDVRRTLYWRVFARHRAVMRDLGSVLSVEDEEIDQRQIHRVMQRSGRVSDLRAFYSADAAVAWIQGAPEAPLDVVLLDINMPRMDGYAFLDLISNDLVKRKVSVFIMLTAEVSPDNAARLREQACVRGFLEKPLTTDHLDQIASKLGVVSPV